MNAAVAVVVVAAVVVDTAGSKEEGTGLVGLWRTQKNQESAGKDQKEGWRAQAWSCFSWTRRCWQ